MGPKYIAAKINKEGRTHCLLNVVKSLFLEKVLASPSNPSSERLPSAHSGKSVTRLSCWVLLFSHDLGKLNTLLRIYYAANG